VHSADDRKADGSVKTGDELNPCRTVVRLGAGPDQLLFRQ